MKERDWKKVADRYYSKEEQAHWAERMKDAPAAFDQAEYSRKWADLGGRVEAAIPLRPDSEEAQALFDEWQALLAPFTAVATPDAMNNARPRKPAPLFPASADRSRARAASARSLPASR